MPHTLAFTVLDLLAGVLWAVPMASLGYYAGGALGPLRGDVRRYEVALALGLVAVAATLLGIRSVRRTVRWRELRFADLHAVVSFAIGLLGVLNLLSAIWPREPAMMRELARWLPLEVTQRSRAVMLLAGLALLQVTRNLGRRKALAWGVAVAALWGPLVSHTLRAFDLHHSLVAALLLAFLIAFRSRFTARSDPASLRQALVMAPVLALTVWVFGLVGLTDLQRHFSWDRGNTPALEALRSGLLIVEPGVDPLRPAAARFLGALQLAGWAARFYLLVLVLRPVILRRRQEAPAAEVERAVPRPRPPLALGARGSAGQAPPERRRRPRARGLRRSRADRLRGRRSAVRGGRPPRRPRATGSSTAGTTAGRRASTKPSRSGASSTATWACAR